MKNFDFINSQVIFQYSYCLFDNPCELEFNSRYHKRGTALCLLLTIRKTCLTAPWNHKRELKCSADFFIDGHGNQEPDPIS